MSRSYKKTNVSKQTYRNSKTIRFFKRQASKRVRKSMDISDGMSYKRHYLRYYIFEFRFYCTLKDWMNSYNRFVKDKKINTWKKWYFRK